MTSKRTLASVAGTLLWLATLGVSAQAAQALAQDAYVKASNPNNYDGFSRVAVSGDTLIVGAIGEDSGSPGVNGDQADDSAPQSGAAYVFVREASGWRQQAYLKSPAPGHGHNFGHSVDVSGEIVVVGEPSPQSGLETGKAIVFVRNGTTWVQQAVLTSASPDLVDNFGWSVAIDGETIVVGARLEDGASAGVNGDEENDDLNSAGAAFVFVRSGDDWVQQAYLKASNPALGDWFGYSVAISGDTVIVGAIGEDSASPGVDGDQDNNDAQLSGAAYVFVREGTTWSQQAYIKASNPGQGDWFGQVVAISQSTAVVGAYAESSSATGVDGDQSDNSAKLAGAAYVFKQTGTSWAQQAYLKASNTDAEDNFAWTVDVSGDTVMVGAFGEDSGATGIDRAPDDDSAMQAGAAYVFRRANDEWAQLAYVKASNTDAGDGFGGSVAVERDTVVIGAAGEASRDHGVNGDQFDDNAPGAGAVYIFDVQPHAWADVGATLAGSAGVPRLSGRGPLTPGSANQLELGHARPSSATTLVVGLAQLGAPFKGGTLVPQPLALVPLLTDSLGEAVLPFRWPSGVPPGAALYLQCWTSDAAAPAGLSASNGLRGTSD